MDASTNLQAALPCRTISGASSLVITQELQQAELARENALGWSVQDPRDSTHDYVGAVAAHSNILSGIKGCARARHVRTQHSETICAKTSSTTVFC